MVLSSLEVDINLLDKVGLALNNHNPDDYVSLRCAISSKVSFIDESLGNSNQTQEIADDCETDTTASTDIADRKYEDYDEDCAFYICDLGEIKYQFSQWCLQLPRIEPWYAVKCNPALPIVETLSNLCKGLDCASKVEIELAISLGVDPSNIIFANPCKFPSHLRFARDVGVTLVTFDNINELEKIARVHPYARIMLRLLVDDSNSVCRFGEKYGAPLQKVPALFAKAKNLGLDLAGVSFHVGSGCRDAQSFRDAVALARKAFDLAINAGFEPLRILDCGGGFPGSKNTEYTGEISFSVIAMELTKAIEEYFPDPSVRIIAEPGRYFACSSTALVTQVHSKRVIPPSISSPGKAMYYLNDGVYGSFNCIIFDHYIVSPRILTRKGSIYVDEQGSYLPKYPSCLWGPTCDSMDCIMKDVMLPELFAGDWICFPNMGAYTASAASNFNGLYSTRTLYIDTNTK